MAHHPQGVAEATASFIVRDFWRIAVTLATAFALVGCTFLGIEPPPPPNARTLPADQFPGLADRDPDIITSAEGLAADGSDVVALVEADGGITLPTFWHSTDSGVSWTRGQLSVEAAEATEIAEDLLGHAAVTVGEDGRRWLGLGRKGQDLIAWTSADGQTWGRSVVVGIDANDAGTNEVLGSSSGS